MRGWLHLADSFRIKIAHIESVFDKAGATVIVTVSGFQHNIYGMTVSEVMRLIEMDEANR